MKHQKAPHIIHAQAMPEGTPEVPVCIVGGGACGLTAAIALRKAGIDVLVLERDESGTGSSALNLGQRQLHLAGQFFNQFEFTGA